MTDQDKLYVVVDALIDMGKVGAQVMDDGHVGLSDVPVLVGLLPELLPMLADLGSVPSAVKSMSSTDAEALVAHLITKLELSTPKATAVADAALRVAAALIELYATVKS